MKEKVLVFLDLDDTILDFHKAERIAVSDTFREMGLFPTEELLNRYSTINAECWRKLERGEWTRSEVLTRRFEILFREFGVNLSGQEAMHIYENRLMIGHYFMEGAEQLLQDLKKDCRLFLVSNGTGCVQDSRLKSAGILPCFEKIFISERVGFEKPDRRFFEKCFSDIPDFAVEKAIILGDSLTSDIQGGINAGIRTCLFDPTGNKQSGDIRPDYRIKRLSEFPKLIQKLFA